MDFKQNVSLLEKQLAELNSTQDNILVKADKAIVLCRVVLCKLKTEIIKNGFSDLQKEILFFKQLKQVALSSLVYYFKIKSKFNVPAQAVSVGDFKRDQGTTYFFDLKEFLHYFKLWCMWQSVN